MYRYNRLISLNEVGGEPGSYGASLARPSTLQTPTTAYLALAARDARHLYP